MVNHLLVASGGGGDAIAAVMVAAPVADGEHLHVATFSWDRLIIDPVPGPRAVAGFIGLEPVGRWNYRVLPSTSLHAPAASTLPRLSAELPARIYLLDPHQGVVGLQQQLRELVDILRVRRTYVIDVGGDIVAAGNETGLRSPLADSLTLAAVQALDGSVTVLVAGPGLDGELTEDEVRERCRTLAPEAPPERLSYADAYIGGPVFQWHLSEAAGMLRAAAMNARGVVELRDHGALVRLTDQSTEIWFLDATRVFDASRTAQALSASRSLHEAERALLAIGRSSEIEYERRKAAGSRDRHQAHDPGAAFAERLAQVEADAVKRGVDFLTIRRLAELLHLRGESALQLGLQLRHHAPHRYVPPLWAVNRPVERTLATAGPMAPISPCRTDSPRPPEPPPPPPFMVPPSGNLTLVPAHHDRVVLAPPGARISVELPGDGSHRWTEVQSTNEAVLVPIDVLLDFRGGCSASFRTDEVGEAQLLATDRPRPPSRRPERPWRVTVMVAR